MDSRPDLRELQRWLKWLVTSRKNAQAALFFAENEPEPSGLPVIAHAPPLSVVERLDIYGQGYYLRLADCVRKTFACAAWLAERNARHEAFELALAEYIEQHPSTDFNIDRYPQGFPDFLSARPLATELPQLPDLLRLEWAVAEAMLTPSLPSRVAEQIGSLRENQWEHIRFTLDPTLRLLETRWRVAQTWRRRERAAPSRRARTFLAVWRNLAGEPRVRTLPVGEYLALSALRDGCALGEMPRTAPDEARQRSWFRTWVESGMIREILFPT